MRKPPVILLDMSNLIFRSGYAFEQLRGPGGVKSGAIYGTLKTILELRKKVSPRIVAVWDHGVPTSPDAAKPANWRDKLVTDYKANRVRNAGSREIVAQMPAIYDALRWIGYCSISVMGMEADDVIGVLARQIELSTDVLIFSTDIDFYQLLTPFVSIVRPKQENGEYRILTRDDVESEFTTPVSRWAEYLALGGDKSDNIKVKGMGPATAERMIAAGIRLTKPLYKQPLDKLLPLDKKKLEDHWEDIQKAYYAAKLPTSTLDERIHPCVRRAGGWPLFHTEQLLREPEECFEKFSTMLANYNMLSLHKQRHEFYDGVYSPCPTPTPSTPTPTTTRAHASKPQPQRLKQKPLF